MIEPDVFALSVCRALFRSVALTESEFLRSTKFKVRFRLQQFLVKIKCQKFS